MRELTERQNEILAFITQYKEGHDYPPTVREVADHFGISVKGAYDHLTALKKKNRLRYGDKRSRTMEVLRADYEEEALPAFVEIPILGKVAAGLPLNAEENFDGAVAIPQTMLGKGCDYFALRVQGDSMADAIQNGDLAIIEQQDTARDGEIVVVSLEDGVTLKRFFRESSRILLKPDNQAYKEIYCQEVRVLGRLAGLIRTY